RGHTSRRVEPPPAQTGGPESGTGTFAAGWSWSGSAASPSEAKGVHFVPSHHFTSRSPRAPRVAIAIDRMPHAVAEMGGSTGESGPPFKTTPPSDSNSANSFPSHGLCNRTPDAPSAKTSIVPGKRLHATGALVRPIGTPTEPNHAAGDPIDSNPPHSVPLSVPWTNSPSGPRATSWISPGAVAQAPIGQSTGTVVLPSRAS